jgi:ankyrin repeat protein
MSEPRSLPSRPSLRRLRDEAKGRGKSGEFPSIARAQLAIAREYGFASWPRLKFQVEAVTLDAAERAAVLIASATSADLRRARALLDADPALARHDLATACATGEADEVTRRLSARPTAVSELTGPNRWEPILYACFTRLLRGDPERAPGIREVVRRLLAAGADPNAFYINEDGWLQVPLYGAAGIAGDSELTRMLLEAGADPTDDREGYAGNEILYHAAELSDPTCAMLVIDAGARQDLVDYDLGRALNFPNHAMVEIFCTHGARASAEHLHQAVWRRRPPETIAALLDAGAPIDAPDEHGLTSLQVAVRWADDAIVAILCERGADEARVADQDRAIGRYLASNGGSLPSGLTPAMLDEMLLLSIQGGHLDAMRSLLDAGARIDGDSGTDGVPLGQACWRGRVQMVRELVQRGAALTHSITVAPRSERRCTGRATATSRRAARRCRRSGRSPAPHTLRSSSSWSPQGRRYPSGSETAAPRWRR